MFPFSWWIEQIKILELLMRYMENCFYNDLFTAVFLLLSFLQEKYVLRVTHAIVFVIEKADIF